MEQYLRRSFAGLGGSHFCYGAWCCLGHSGWKDLLWFEGWNDCRREVDVGSGHVSRRHSDRAYRGTMQWHFAETMSAKSL